MINIHEGCGWHLEKDLACIIWRQFLVESIYLFDVLFVGTRAFIYHAAATGLKPLRLPRARE